MDKLREKYKSYSDEHLLHMLANREDYIEEAIQVIEALVAERKIDPKKIENTLEEIQSIKREKEKIENEPLGSGMKILLIVFPIIGIIGMGMIQLHYHEGGYEQKKADIPKYMFLGFLLWMIIAFIANT